MSTGAHPRAREERARPLLRQAAIAAVIALAAGAAGWSLQTVLAPPPDVLAAAPFTTTEAAEGTVGQSITLNATAAWTTQQSVANQADGMVTSVDAPAGSRVEAGQVLYRVDLRPVVAAAGEVPAFRDIAPGDRGEDVRQLQQMLTDIGEYDGAVDGHAGRNTVRAIQAWQRGLGVEPDGTVRLGDVLFLPSAPATVSYDGIAVGQPVTPGSGTVDVLGSAPEFTISLSDSQARTVTAGMAVTLVRDDSTWEATVSEVAPGSTEEPASATLASTDDRTICREECATVPVTSDTTLAATVIVVAEQSGIVVPAAALTSTPEEQTVADSAEGDLLPVTVITTARGAALVEGLEAGTQVRVPGVLPSTEEAAD